MNRIKRVRILFRLEGIAVIRDPSVSELYDPCCIFLCKLRIVCNHNHKAVLGDFLEKIHNLNTGICIKCSCRLIREKDVRIIDKSSCDRNSLHLTA